jgi:opacity protein-like surface antigen
MKTGHMTWLLAALALSASPLALAATGDNYAGGQYAITTYHNDTGTEDADMGVLMFRLGKEINPNLSVEGRLGIGIADDTAGITTLETDSILGIYAIGRLPVSKDFDVYGVLGYTRIELTLTISGLGSVSSDDTDISYGLGGEFRVDDKWSVNLEYMNYYDEGIEEVTALSLGANYRF